MSISTPENAVEATVLDSIADLHSAMYARLSTITGISNLEFLGFDSGKSRNPLPKVALHINLDAMEIDRKRPTPLEGNRLEINQGSELIQTYDGQTFTGYEERKFKYPLPVVLNYNITAWCYSAETQLNLIMAIFQKFPERGVITLPIGDNDFDFPIELLGMETLDDLSQNLRERLFRFRIEAWVDGNIADETREIITSSEIAIHKGSEIEDINLVGNRIPIDDILADPE